MNALRRLIRTLRIVRGAIALSCWSIVTRSRALTRCFGFLLGGVSREVRAVQAGRLEFRRLHEEGRLRSSAMLRRNIHRLEKGLTMKSRQPVFGVDYIGETVELYETSVDSLEADEQRWAHDVLTLYFSVVDPHLTIDLARRQFESRSEGRLPVQIPYRADSRPPLNIDYSSLRQLAERRRSIRWFEQKAVPEGLIKQAMDLARQAPSACNRQPYYFKYIGDAGHSQQIASIAMGTAGYASQLPALVVVIGDWSCLAEERDRHIPYIDAALASMQFMLACETLGLGTCPINWPDVEALERRMDNALNLPLFQRPVMLIAVGYPDPEGGVARSTKKPVGDLLR
jgi:nitroreductase